VPADFDINTFELYTGDDMLLGDAPAKWALFISEGFFRIKRSGERYHTEIIGRYKSSHLSAEHAIQSLEVQKRIAAKHVQGMIEPLVEAAQVALEAAKRNQDVTLVHWLKQALDKIGAPHEYVS
jgi:hypothetical protein